MKEKTNEKGNKETSEMHGEEHSSGYSDEHGEIAGEKPQKIKIHKLLIIIGSVFVALVVFFAFFVIPHITQKQETTSEENSAQTAKTETAQSDTTNDEILVVNKKHPLSKDYAPGENKEAVEQLTQLIVAGQSSNDAYAKHLTYQWSGFRTYDEQARVYENEVSEMGEENANKYAAKPGYSEHQTGLAFDLITDNNMLYRVDDPAYNYKTDWVAQHASNYGFIVRYRDETESLTGYAGEPWHLRYLGVEVAKMVFESGVTLEEYTGINGGNYE
jgi:D-alanyl-D-alanine carboxypeptidase